AGGYVVQVLLHDSIAPARESRVLVAYDGGGDRQLICRVLGPVDETDQVAVVEMLEAMHLIDGGHCPAEPNHELRREFEAEVHSGGTDVEEDVAGRGHGMTRLRPDLPERMELRRSRSAEKPVPGGGTEPHDAGEVALEVAKGDHTNEGREVFTEASNSLAMVIAGVDRNHQEDRGARQRCDHRLRLPLAQLALQVLHSPTRQ